MNTIDRSFVPSSELEIRDVARVAEADLNLAGFPGVSGALVEVLKNAHEHGNSGDLSKRISFRTEIDLHFARVIVEDEGTLVDPSFFNYCGVLGSSSGRISEGFYNFAERLSPKGHSGAGVKLSFLAFDEAKYSQNKNGGVRVELTKYKI